MTEKKREREREIKIFFDLQVLRCSVRLLTIKKDNLLNIKVAKSGF